MCSSSVLSETGVAVIAGNDVVLTLMCYNLWKNSQAVDQMSTLKAACLTEVWKLRYSIKEQDDANLWSCAYYEQTAYQSYPSCVKENKVTKQHNCKWCPCRGDSFICVDVWIISETLQFYIIMYNNIQSCVVLLTCLTLFTAAWFIHLSTNFKHFNNPTACFPLQHFHERKTCSRDVCKNCYNLFCIFSNGSVGHYLPYMHFFYSFTVCWLSVSLFIIL